MGDVVRFAKKTEASKARVGAMAADAIAHLARVSQAQGQQTRDRRVLTQAAENARRAIRELHYAAAKDGERLWAARVVREELKQIQEHIQPGDL